jgi:hypothetical protein
MATNVSTTLAPEGAPNGYNRNHKHRGVTYGY